jgi:hypothetical protein
MDTKSDAPVKKILVVAVVVVLAIVLGLAGYFLRPCAKTVPEKAKEQVAKASGHIVLPSVPATQQPNAHIAAKELPSRALPLLTAEDICKEHQKKLRLIFAYLDRREYIKSRQLAGGSFQYFKNILERLWESPPSVPLETDNLLSILRNRAHFYRILGKKDVLLLRDVLKNENNIAESSFATFYQAFTLRKKCKKEDLLLDVRLESLYPYAVFFLDTLGGSSYLMRRDSRVRTLARYYCVLVIDQTNQRNLNNMGFNILPQLDLLIRDMKSASNLTEKEKYLHTLDNIRARY